MLHRTGDDGLAVITQPAHAWISGQLASAWGNDDSGLSRPSREVRLAAEQHDIAWLDWEAAPSLNPGAGLPYAFNQFPTLDHLAIWANATSRALSYGRYPALLISMHGTYLYERFHDFESDSSDEAQAARDFLDREHSMQESIIGALMTTRDVSRDEVERDRRLVSLWDAMSLALCMGIEEPRTFSDVPAESGSKTLALSRSDDSGRAFEIAPWPFAFERVEVGCEARRLEGPFGDVASMRAALGAAPTLQLEFTLAPG